MSTETAPWSRKNPYPAKLLVNRGLSGPYSANDTRHYELSLADSGLTYEAGDAVGVVESNCLNLVQEVLDALRCTGDELIPSGEGEPKRLREALWKDYAITKPSPQFLHALVEKAGDSAPFLRDLLTPDQKEALEHYLDGLHIVDLLEEHPSARFTAEEFVKGLRKLTPRLYSISSSPKTHPQHVHLTVATVRYESKGRLRKGVCSTYLAERVAVGAIVPIFFHVAKGFRLPEDGNTPIIMVGAGTGIAPYRAFLQERIATGAKGANWLFFGDQREKEDFLYGEEFQKMQADCILTRLNTAFSRDQEEKIYVQHRMLENSAEIWKWLEQGAHFFVCGDASRMAKDVHAALRTIIENESGKTPEEAALYLEAMEKAKRYKRDVY
ncbi:MAG: sulfite reductase subunit alpha [Verrucomicrobiota bacterium]